MTVKQEFARVLITNVMDKAFQHLESFLPYFRDNDPDINTGSQVARSVKNAAATTTSSSIMKRRKPKSSCLWILSSAQRGSLASFNKGSAF
jgi:hypothetical protein